jgi:menaquinol-cytochrome c reductase cytochrome b/c subunit
VSVKDPRLYWDYERGRRGSTGLRERRARHTRYKEDVEERGKPFFPHAMFHDTVMSLVVVSVIIALACIWYFDSTEEPGEEGAGVLGPRYTEEADPGTTSFIPRPDWYFYFLFYLLRIFKWPDTVILGTVGIPTILLILLFALPFIDVRRERRILRRPVAVVTAILVVLSMGVLTYKGAVAEEGLAPSDTEALVGDWVQTYNLPGEVREGAALFAESGCLSCHVYGDIGGAVGPELTDVGLQQQGVDYYVRYIRDPSAFGNSVMPQYDLPVAQLRAFGEFLEASKGEGG